MIRFGWIAAAAACVMAAPASAATFTTYMFDFNTAPLGFFSFENDQISVGAEVIAADDPRNPFGSQAGTGRVGFSPASALQADFRYRLSRIEFDATAPGADPLTVYLTSVNNSFTGYYSTAYVLLPGVTTRIVFDDLTYGAYLSDVLSEGAFLPTTAIIDNVMIIFAAGVPEPATWALMIGGIGAVGGSLRRRAGLTPQRTG